MRPSQDVETPPPSVQQSVALRAATERAKSDGWTVSYEADGAQWAGVATRGQIRLTCNAGTVVEALLAVLAETRLPNLGSPLARVIPLRRPQLSSVMPPCYGSCGGCERDCPA